MVTLASSQDERHSYVLFERPAEVGPLSLTGLGYFEKALGVKDYRKHIQRWIRRPAPLVLGCLEQERMVGWAMCEPWDRRDRDSTPIFVLRMIEVAQDRRKCGIGRALVILSGLLAPGHMVTRPLSGDSENFFTGLGFIRPPSDCAVELRDKYGYLLLPATAKQRLAEQNNGAITLREAIVRQCADQQRAQVLRDEITRTTGFAQAFAAAVAPGQHEPSALSERRLIQSGTAQVPCACGRREVAFYAIRNGERDYLGVECVQCGRVWLTVPV